MNTQDKQPTPASVDIIAEKWAGKCEYTDYLTILPKVKLAITESTAEKDKEIERLSDKVKTFEFELSIWRKCDAILDADPSSTDDPTYINIRRIINQRDELLAQLAAEKRENQIHMDIFSGIIDLVSPNPSNENITMAVKRVVTQLAASREDAERLAKSVKKLNICGNYEADDNLAAHAKLKEDK